MAGFFSRLFGGGAPPFATTNAEDAHASAKRKNAILIDVRSPDEWEATGLPAHAHPVCLQDASMVAKIHEIANEDLDRPLAVICRSGARSAQACRLLTRAGFTQVSNVKGGMMQWQALKLPIKAYHGL